jgi:hypothetical protein
MSLLGHKRFLVDQADPYFKPSRIAIAARVGIEIPQPWTPAIENAAALTGFYAGLPTTETLAAPHGGGHKEMRDEVDASIADQADKPRSYTEAIRRLMRPTLDRWLKEQIEKRQRERSHFSIIKCHSGLSRQINKKCRLRTATTENVRPRMASQLAEQRLGVLQDRRVEAFGEPAVDRRK